MRKIGPTRRVSSGLMRLNWSSLAIETLLTFGETKIEAFNLKNTVPTETHSGGCIILWGCVAASETGNLAEVEGITD